MTEYLIDFGPQPGEGSELLIHPLDDGRLALAVGDLEWGQYNLTREQVLKLTLALGGWLGETQ